MGLNKRLKSKSGAVSVYLCIIMSAVILLGGVLVDVARIKGAQTITEDTTVSVTRSLMSFYNRDLEKYYGILGVDIKPEVKVAIQELFLKNIAVDEGVDVFRLKLEKLNVNGGKTLESDETLKNQIASHCVDDLAQEWITDKLESFSILKELYKHKDLIGNLLPDPAEAAKGEYTKISTSLKESGEVGKALVGVSEQLLINEYILNHFNFYTGNTNVASTKNDEVEYVLTGFDTPGARKAAVIGLLTGTRFALNLGYFVTSPVMMEKALVYATAVAGWSGVGIPVAQWAIILAWCVAESAIDVTQLLDGKSVPLVKSPTTWVLSESGLIDAAKDVVEERAKEAAKTIVDESFDEIEKVVNKAITDIEASIDSQLNQLINKLAEPLETKINNLSSMGLSEANKVVNSCFLGIQDEINSYNGDGIVFEALKTYSQSWLEEIQTKIISEVEDAVSKPEMIISKYKKMLVQKIKEPLTLVKEQLISEIKAASKQGRDALKSKISKIFASDRDSESSGDLASKNYKSGFITMRYKDYLRLYLLVVPEKDKFIRIRKIIEENIQKKSGDTGFTINRLNTIVKADVQVSTKYFLISPNLIPSQYKSGDNNRHLIKSTYEVAYLGGKIQ